MTGFYNDDGDIESNTMAYLTVWTVLVPWSEMIVLPCSIFDRISQVSSYNGYNRNIGQAVMAYKINSIYAAVRSSGAAKAWAEGCR